VDVVPDWSVSGRLEVRSYRTCFDLERRIHRIDRWRLPVPWGVPLRGVVYALAALAAIFVGGALPLVGGAIGALPAPLRLVVLPVGVAVMLFRWRVDGRPAHRALVALARQSLGGQQIASYRRRRSVAATRYAIVAVARDAPDSGARARVVGPARVTVRGCAEVGRSRLWRRRLVVRPDLSLDRTVDVDVARGEVLEVAR
jgi:hypothetical protein